MSTPMTPREVVDRIFTRLLARYGSAWLRMWSGQDEDQVKEDWVDVLGRYLESPRAIRFALDNLPSDRAPNAMQFRDLCRGVPERPLNALPAPKNNDPAKVAEVRQKAVHIVREQRDRFNAGGLQRWLDVQSRIDAGERVSLGVRDMCRRALARSGQ